MHSYTIISLAALAALTAAAPHANKHALFHRSLDLGALVERADAGACGGSAGSCGAGYCCSAYGYCGISPAYCAAGCQSAFGTCSNNSTATSARTSLSSSLTVTIKEAEHTYPGRPGQTKSTTVLSSSAASVAPASTKTSTTTLKSTTFAVSTVTSTTTSSTSTKATSSVAAPISTATSAKPSTTVVATSTSSTSSAASPTSTGSSGGSGSDTYKTYTGVGTTAAGWPDMSAWVNFDSMWTANMAYISISCTQFGEPNNSDQESADLKTAIQSVASSSSIDQRFILAVVMQESKGCVRAPTVCDPHPFLERWKLTYIPDQRWRKQPRLDAIPRWCRHLQQRWNGPKPLPVQPNHSDGQGRFDRNSRW